MQFGRKQIGKPTPAGLEFWSKIYIGIMGLFLAWMPTNNIVPHHAQDVITPIANLINSIIIFLLPFFGIPVEDKKMVPVEDVKVMEEKTE
jgi:hypothetical protein